MSVRRIAKKFKCDMCGFHDGHNGSNLCECKRCGVLVHDRCYGMPYDTDLSDFVCWACRAVGQSFEADDNGTILKVIQKRRPTLCDLCGHRGGLHAMHPLYDNHGRSGRQILMKDPSARLSWAHSLCCFYLSQKGGVVYGCNRGGAFAGCNEEEDSDIDDRPENRTLLEGYRPEEETGEIHHFVYCLQRPGMPANQWVKFIRNCQNTLKCIICGLDDSPEGVLRVAVQCSANDENEYEHFRQFHRMPPDETCTVPMHVGCARWNSDGHQKVRQVYFFPGSEEEGHMSVPEMHVYCLAHATAIRQGQAAESLRKRQQAQSKLPAVARRPRVQSADVSPLPSLQRQPSSSAAASAQAHSKKRQTSSASSKKDRTNGTSRNATDQEILEAAARQRPGKRKFETARVSAVALSDLRRPSLASKKTDIAAESQKTRPKGHALERMKKDMLPNILDMSVDERKEFVKAKKKYWSRESSLPTTDFKAVWKDVKDYLSAKILEHEGRSEQKRQALFEESKRAEAAGKAGLADGSDELRRRSTASEASIMSAAHAAIAEFERNEGSMRAVGSSSSDDEPLITLQEDDGGYRVAWQYTDEELDEHPAGWELSDSRWSEYIVGPMYGGEAFEFGDWDEVIID